MTPGRGRGGPAAPTRYSRVPWPRLSSLRSEKRVAAQLCALPNWENFEKGPLRSHFGGKAEAVHSDGFLEVRVGTFSLLENHHRRATETLRPHPGDGRNEVWLGAPRLSATCAHAGRKLVWRAPARGDAAAGPGTRRPSSPSSAGGESERTLR